jgi:hypothetical protein
MPDVPIDLMENGNYVLALFDGKVETEETIKIFFNPIYGDLSKQPLSNITFLIEIVIPNRLWILEGMGQLRGYRILDELAQMVDQQNVAGIGEVEILNFKASKLADTNYSVLSANIKVNSSSLKGLR